MNDSDWKQYEEFRKTIATSGFSKAAYDRRIEKPWGWEVHFTPDNLPYMGKIIHVNEGSRISLQSHDKKQESWMLTSGKMVLIIETPHGTMEEIGMKAGTGYSCALGQKHRLMGGKGGGEVFEVSTPELGKTYRLEDDYNRGVETETDRAQRNRSKE